MKAKVFNYTIVKTFPISDLEKFKSHRRLRVFYYKGCKCINCGLEATQIGLGVKKGQTHLDVYTDDFYPLTIDHTIPKSKGGSNTLDNLEPMCAKCNNVKGAQLEWDGKTRKKEKQKGPGNTPKSKSVKGEFEKYGNKLKIGDTVYVARGKHNVHFLGIVSEFTINKHINERQFKIEGNEISMYSIKRALKKVE